ncbi:MAG: helix-turn-helix domain-containing protein [Planctomycetota bacterium]
MRKRREHFANHLWKYRNRIGYSQTDVAEILGRSNSTQICQWEKGVVMPSLENVIKLGLTATFLLKSSLLVYTRLHGVC